MIAQMWLSHQITRTISLSKFFSKDICALNWHLKVCMTLPTVRTTTYIIVLIYNNIYYYTHYILA